MFPRKRTFLLIGTAVALLILLWLVLTPNCPSSGIAFTRRARLLHQLKNRTAIPNTSDFDSRITLDALLQTGDDTNRWQTDRAARIQGEVLDVAYARPEATNCFSPCRRDIHIVIAARMNAPKKEQAILEVTPNLRDWASKRGMDWSEPALRAQLIGHWCEFEGWLYYDVGHAEESENIAPNNPNNWRATAWEIHPVTAMNVIR